MEPITITFIATAFFAGTLMFFAPCTLPLVPAYLGFLSGVSARDVKNVQLTYAEQKKIRNNALAFIIGFILVFIFLGTIAGFLGQILFTFRIWIERIGGLLIILFGLSMLGVFSLPGLSSSKRFTVSALSSKRGYPFYSFITGVTFAFAWTPCIGPTLASILLLASISTTAFNGALLLFIFSVGFAIPFLLLAYAFSKAVQYLHHLERYLKWISIIGGVFLIVLGMLLLTDNFELLVRYGFSLFNFLNYDSILKFL